MPAAVVGRLAADLRNRGREPGEVLLLGAIRRVVRAGTTIAVYAMIVDAGKDRARAFRERFGSRSLACLPLRLFLPLQTFEQG